MAEEVFPDPEGMRGMGRMELTGSVFDGGGEVWRVRDTDGSKWPLRKWTSACSSRKLISPLEREPRLESRWGLGGGEGGGKGKSSEPG